MSHTVNLLGEVKAEQVSAPTRRIWPLIAAVPILVVIAAAICWSFGHPFGIHWDETIYLNDAGIDVQHLRSGMFVKLAGSMLKSWARPPAYRVFALPFLALFGFHTVIARLVSLACYSLSSWIIYLATRRVAGRVASIFAVLVFALSTEVVVSSTFFSTEGPLFLATAGMLYFLLRYWSGTAGGKYNWIGFGLSIGVGFLSKASFALIAIPVLAFFLIDAHRNGLDQRVGSFLLRAGALAFAIAGPWWLLNFRSAFAYAGYARDQSRSSLGASLLATWAQWLGTVCLGLLGPAVSVLIVIVALAALQRRARSRKAILNPVQRTTLYACAFAGLPMVAAQLSGTNHLLRYLAPAVIPLAIAVGVLSDQSGWVRSKIAITLSSVLLLIQLAMIVAPVALANNRPIDPGLVNGALPWRILVRFDQWDWRIVRDISRTCGIATPKIAYLGNGRAFNPPQIQFPWVVAGEAAPEATWLWRYEDGPLIWEKVSNSVAQSDVVLTAPYYVGQLTDKQNLDNQHNAEFADLLSRDPRFRGPIRVEMGRFERVEVDVFLKKALVCRQETSIAH